MMGSAGWMARHGGNHLLAARATRTFRAGSSTVPGALAPAQDLKPQQG
jgi:hypothetical protein